MGGGRDAASSEVMVLSTIRREGVIPYSMESVRFRPRRDIAAGAFPAKP